MCKKFSRLEACRFQLVKDAKTCGKITWFWSLPRWIHEDIPWHSTSTMLLIILFLVLQLHMSLQILLNKSLNFLHMSLQLILIQSGKMFAHVFATLTHKKMAKKLHMSLQLLLIKSGQIIFLNEYQIILHWANKTQDLCQKFATFWWTKVAKTRAKIIWFWRLPPRIHEDIPWQPTSTMLLIILFLVQPGNKQEFKFLYQPFTNFVSCWTLL